MPHTDIAVLTAAHDTWLDAASFRRQRDRHKRYTYGDQWSDIVLDEHDKPIIEYDHICRSGRKPLTNNVIRQIVKIVVGRFRHECSGDRSDPVHSSLLELDCRMLEEFLISGCAVQRISNHWRLASSGIAVDNVDPRLFFVNPYKDPLGRDIEMIGMLHDMSFPEIISRFAAGNPALASSLARTYSSSSAMDMLSRPQLGSAGAGADDFFTSSSGRCRVIEVWTLDCRNNLICHDRNDASLFRTANSADARRHIAGINASRLADGKPGLAARTSIDFVWHCRWFAPDGTLIASYDSPFRHHSHPFAIKLYPLTDGEIHSFVEDVIDQQKCINRLIVLIDHMIGSSAKGVLLFPIDQKPKEYDWKDIVTQWSKSNGVIPIMGRNAVMPQQVITSPSDHSAYQLLELQMKLFDNISGIGDVIAGRNVSAATGNALYESQLQNSTIALADILKTFDAFRNDRDLKLHNM